MNDAPLNATEAQALILSKYGLRIEPEMAQYWLRKMSSQPAVQLIGGDARTGVPRRENIAAASLNPPITNRNPA